MKDRVLKALDSLGFKIEKAKDNMYEFSYEGKQLAYCYEEEYKNLLCIIVPYLFIGKKRLGRYYYLLIDELNARLKYVKFTGVACHISVEYEREIIGDENIEQILTRMIYCLDDAVTEFNESVASLQRRLALEEESDDDDTFVDDDEADFDDWSVLVGDDEDE